MDFETFLPHPVLQPYIQSYWTIKAKAGSFFDSTKFCPDGCIKLIIHFGNRYYQKEGANMVQQGNCFVHGQYATAIDIIADGTVDILGVKLYPSGWSAFSHIPAKILTGYRAKLRDLWGSPGDKLHHQLFQSDQLHERLRYLDQFFLGRIAHANSIDPAVTASIQHQFANRGNVPVGSLADKFFRTQRTLERQYAKQVGLTPKQMGRIIRINQMVKESLMSPAKKLAELSYKFGYYDQAHFNNDFKKITGFQPLQFLQLQGGDIKKIVKTNQKLDQQR